MLDTENWSPLEAAVPSSYKVFPGAELVVFALGCWCAVVNSFIQLSNSFLLAENISTHEEEAGGMQTPPHVSNPQV